MGLRRSIIIYVYSVIYMKSKRLVALGFLGSTLDRGPQDAKRWKLWRPTVSLFQQSDLDISRFELFYSKKFDPLATQIAADIKSASPKTVTKSHPTEIKDAWDFEEVYGTLLDFSLSYPWNVEEEEYLLHITTGTHVAQICMFLLAESRYIPAKLIQTSPPSRGDSNREGTFKIIDLDLSKYDRITSRFNKARKDDLSFLKSGIETKNEKFNHLIEQIEKVAVSSREPILLLGPTGAGKSQLARRIYELKKQRGQIKGSFIDVNCATIRGDGAMSALFGHTKGSFTGAVKSRNGHLLTANEGILFLDEIGELGLDEQAMLLRALEEKIFFPLGADKEITSDFQLIAGTNRNLQALCRQGEFREDLLARINLWSFTLPSLRERKEDIAPNIAYELERFSQKHNLQVSFNKEAREEYCKFATSVQAHWTSNFRDLNASITRLATLATAGRISLQIVKEEIQRLKNTWSTISSEEDLSELSDYFGFSEELFDQIDRFERAQLIDVLKLCKKSRSLAEAGRELFAISRKDKPNYNDADRLRKYLGRFNISWKGQRQNRN